MRRGAAGNEYTMTRLACGWVAEATAFDAEAHAPGTRVCTTGQRGGRGGVSCSCTALQQECGEEGHTSVYRHRKVTGEQQENFSRNWVCCA
jgi:hypothetical protein